VTFSTLADLAFALDLDIQVMRRPKTSTRAHEPVRVRTVA